MRKLTKSTKKIFIGLAGATLLLLGILMIPYPGPGWLLVFLALTILGTEFDWAKRLNDYARSKYDTWRSWLGRQASFIRLLFWLMTAIIVILTIWVFNGYGIVNDWLNLGQDWLRSPLTR